MDETEKDLAVPVVSEALNVDAVPVVTGGVRVTKRVHTHDEVLEQQLRKTHADVKRIKVNRIVDGPQPVQRVGNTTVIPIVSEELHIEKRWVLTEEIHITQTEETETVQQTVPVRYEDAEIERLDESGNAVETLQSTPAPLREVSAADLPAERTSPGSILDRSRAVKEDAAATRSRKSLLRKKSSSAGA
jgi:stress response protein YsnF